VRTGNLQQFLKQDPATAEAMMTSVDDLSEIVDKVNK